MDYTISNELKQEIRQIPKFNCDLSKIKDIHAVCRTYGIGTDETIIAYRVVPKLFAKLETGGAIFTDKAVYVKFISPHGTDYTTSSLKYIDFVNYIPVYNYFGYSEANLIGTFNDNKDFTFWFTSENDSNIASCKAIVDLFEKVIQEVSASDEQCRECCEKTMQNLISSLLKESLENEGKLSQWKNYSVICNLLSKNRLNDAQAADAVFIIFSYNFSLENYGDAYACVEKYSYLLKISDLSFQIDKLVRQTVDNVKKSINKKTCELFQIVCEKNNSYIPELLDDIFTYYYNSATQYDILDEFIQKFDKTDYADTINTMQIKDIAARLILGSACENINDKPFREFLLYAMKFNRFFEEAASCMMEQYLDLEQFNDAENTLEKIKEMTDNSEFIEQQEQNLSSSKITYAAKLHTVGLEALNNENINDAYDNFSKALDYDCKNKDYILDLLDVLLKLGKTQSVFEQIQKYVQNGVVFAGEQLKKLRDIEIASSKAITDKMCPFFDKLYNGTESDMWEIVKEKKDSPIYKARDIFGLSFYHYAIILKKSIVVRKINIEKTTIPKSVQEYSVFHMGCGDNDADETFVELIRLYNEEAKKLKGTYYLKSTGEVFKEIGKGLVNAALESAASSASSMSGNYRKMAGDNRYAEYSDELLQKSSELSELKDNLKSAKFGSYTESGGSGAREEYNNGLIKLAEEIYPDSLEAMNAIAEKGDFASKVIYLLIKTPKLLWELYHADRSEFQLVEENGRFWYLPRKIVDKVQELDEEKTLKITVVNVHTKILNSSDEDATETCSYVKTIQQILWYL
ncbi:MAG: hypothetical protein HDT21_06690 [Ruminococcus sp.]|nr:hypothetical protein [Ruminococcus sp.]